MAQEYNSDTERVKCPLCKGAGHVGDCEYNNCHFKHRELCLYCMGRGQIVKE